MDLTNEAHLNILIEKHSKFYDAFSGYKVTPHGALHLYKTVYFTQISFSLPTTSLKSSEIQSLQSKVISSLLRKLKLPPTFPRALVFSSHTRLALDVPDFEFTQGLQKVEKLIAHMRMGTSVGTLLEIVIEWYQIMSGTQEQVLKDTAPLDYVYCPWITSLRELLMKTGTHLIIPELWKPQPQREHDDSS